MTDPTSATVQALWNFLSEHYHARVISKADDPTMQIVGEGLELFGIQDKQTFLHNFSTTIGHTIWTPEPVGHPTSCSLWEQLKLGVHEHTHIWQYDRCEFLGLNDLPTVKSG